MRPPPTIRPTATRTRRTEAKADCGASVTEDGETRTLAFAEHLNRGLAVTDKRACTWQKRSIRCKRGPSPSVCREFPPAMLAVSVRRMYRLRYESLRAGVATLERVGARSGSN